MHFDSIGIIAKSDNAQITETVRALYDFVDEYGLKICCDIKASNCIAKASVHTVDLEKMAHEIDLAIVVGGDGTLLRAAHHMVDHGIPIVGINQGRLGFLADISPQTLQQDLSKILAGEYLQEDRSVLIASMMRDEKQMSYGIAVNDVVIHASDVVRMIEIDTTINDAKLNTLRADGLVVATPTGSTAYALSGGGPIVHPSVAATLLVPICPHTLSYRPIAIDEKSRVEITYANNNEFTAVLSVDGQINSKLIPGDRIIIEHASQPLHLLHLNDYSYFNVLRQKLNWSQ